MNFLVRTCLHSQYAQSTLVQVSYGVNAILHFDNYFILLSLLFAQRVMSVQDIFSPLSFVHDTKSV